MLRSDACCVVVCVNMCSVSGASDICFLFDSVIGTVGTSLCVPCSSFAFVNPCLKHSYGIKMFHHGVSTGEKLCVHWLDFETHSCCADRGVSSRECGRRGTCRTHFAQSAMKENCELFRCHLSSSCFVCFCSLLRVVRSRWVGRRSGIFTLSEILSKSENVLCPSWFSGFESTQEISFF